LEFSKTVCNKSNRKRRTDAFKAPSTSNYAPMNRNSSVPEITRRRFLEGCAGTLGVALVGCSSSTQDTKLVAKNGEAGALF
jgi:hypothetical protein